MSTKSRSWAGWGGFGVVSLCSDVREHELPNRCGGRGLLGAEGRGFVAYSQRYGDCPCRVHGASLQ